MASAAIDAESFFKSIGSVPKKPPDTVRGVRSGLPGGDNVRRITLDWH
jgi:hypothetical protein